MEIGKFSEVEKFPRNRKIFHFTNFKKWWQKMGVNKKRWEKKVGKKGVKNVGVKKSRGKKKWGKIDNKKGQNFGGKNPKN